MHAINIVSLLSRVRPFHTAARTGRPGGVWWPRAAAQRTVGVDGRLPTRCRRTEARLLLTHRGAQKGVDDVRNHVKAALAFLQGRLKLVYPSIPRLYLDGHLGMDLHSHQRLRLPKSLLLGGVPPFQLGMEPRDLLHVASITIRRGRPVDKVRSILSGLHAPLLKFHQGRVQRELFLSLPELVPEMLQLLDLCASSYVHVAWPF
mmetsp:Transcript_11761/g.26243  ORF Transcript_11761/g.26243 Transcript_11761/m.26243 type:complete len:204 (-) Transcript_11761:1262-1873(-)